MRIPNTKVGTTEDRPFVPYIPETHDTPEQIDICEHCPLPECDQDDPHCQFATPQYQTARLRGLEQQIAYLCHLLVMKPVYRALAIVRRELRQ